MTEVVYFARATDSRIKIGFTADSSKRLANLSSAIGRDIELLATVPGSRDLEQHLHERFAAARDKGEWFLPTEDLLGFIERVRANGSLAIPAGFNPLPKDKKPVSDEKAEAELAKRLIWKCAGPSSWEEGKPAVLARAARHAGLTYSKSRRIAYGEKVTITYSDMVRMMIAACEYSGDKESLFLVDDAVRPLLELVASKIRARIEQLRPIAFPGHFMDQGE
jgi:hypothetical protein